MKSDYVITEYISGLDIEILKYRDIRKRWSTRQKLNRVFPPLKKLNLHKIIKKSRCI